VTDGLAVAKGVELVAELAVRECVDEAETLADPVSVMSPEAVPILPVAVGLTLATPVELGTLAV